LATTAFDPGAGGGSPGVGLVDSGWADDDEDWTRHRDVDDIAIVGFDGADEQQRRILVVRPSAAAPGIRPAG